MVVSEDDIIRKDGSQSSHSDSYATDNTNSFDPIAEAQMWLEKQEVQDEEDFSFDDHHTKEIERRQWKKTQNTRLGTVAEDLENDFHF